MLHPGHVHIARHPGWFHSPHLEPHGNGKLGVAALVAAAAGGVLVLSVEFKALSPSDDSWIPQPTAVQMAPASTAGITISPVSVIKPPSGIELPAQSIKPPAEILPPVTSQTDVPVVPPEAPVAPEAQAAQEAPAAPVLVAPQPAAPSAPPVVQAQPITGIRDVNFASLPALQALASQLTGRVDPASIIYADLTGDGVQEAIVPISSDGSYGTLGYVVYAESAGAPEPILVRISGPERHGISVVLDRGQLTETTGVYGPSDPNCCPSQLVKTYYRWDGRSLVFDHAETINIPQGKNAD